MKNMCSDERFQELRENNGNTSQQVSKEIQDAIIDIDKENREADEELRAILI